MRMIIDLARALDLQVVAEGIESAERARGAARPRLRARPGLLPGGPARPHERPDAAGARRRVEQPVLRRRPRSLRTRSAQLASTRVEVRGRAPVYRNRAPGRLGLPRGPVPPPPSIAGFPLMSIVRAKPAPINRPARPLTHTYVETGRLRLRGVFRLTHAGHVARSRNSSANPPRGGDAKQEVSVPPRDSSAANSERDTEVRPPMSYSLALPQRIRWGLTAGSIDRDACRRGASSPSRRAAALDRPGDASRRCHLPLARDLADKHPGKFGRGDRPVRERRRAPRARTQLVAGQRRPCHRRAARSSTASPPRMTRRPCDRASPARTGVRAVSLNTGVKQNGLSGGVDTAPAQDLLPGLRPGPQGLVGGDRQGHRRRRDRHRHRRHLPDFRASQTNGTSPRRRDGRQPTPTRRATATATATARTSRASSPATAATARTATRSTATTWASRPTRT